ncbi:hypothetical protein [Dysgonomonas sp.]
MKIIQVNMLKKGNKYACIRIDKAWTTELFVGTELVYWASACGKE